MQMDQMHGAHQSSAHRAPTIEPGAPTLLWAPVQKRALFIVGTLCSCVCRVAVIRPAAAALCRFQPSLLEKAARESLAAAALMALLCLPALASRLGASWRVIDAALILSHLSRSFILLVPDVRAVQLVVCSHMEVVMELCLMWQDLVRLVPRRVMGAIARRAQVL